MKEILEDIRLSKISYLVEKLEKRNVNEKIKTFKKLEKIKITKKIGLYLIKNSTRNFEVNDEFGGINSSLIELCFKNYYDEYNDAIKEVFKDLSDEAKDRVLYLLTTRDDKESLELYTNLVLKYYKKRNNIPIGELAKKPVSYSYVFPKLYKTLKFDIEKNNVLILINSYLNAGIVLKEDLKKNKKLLTDYICKLFSSSLKYKFKNTYEGLNNQDYKSLRYFLELAINIEYYISSKRTKTFLEKILKKNDNQLKLFILDNYFRKQENLSKINFNPIARDKASRYALFELLTIYGKTDLMPKKYLNKQLLAESDLYTNFVIATSYTNEPTNMKFYKKITHDSFEYYAFKFDFKHEFNNTSSDFLTNYIFNQLGMDKYNGKEVTNKFIGVSGGYNKDKEYSVIEKNHNKILIEKLSNEDNIDDVIINLIKKNEIKIEQPKEETQINQTKKKLKNKKERIKKEKVKKEKTKKKKLKQEKFDSNDVSTLEKSSKMEKYGKVASNIFSYFLLFLFTVFIGLLIYCILYIYGIGSLNDGITEKTIKPVKLEDKGNFTEILGTEIFNQTENEYFVLLYNDAKKEKTKYYRYINEYSKRNFRFYYVDLKNEENKFLFGPNELDFILYTDRLLKVKEKEYEYYVDGKTNILNEMQRQIEEIMEKEKEEKKAALKKEKSENFESLVFSITEIETQLKEVPKKKKNLFKKSINLVKYKLETTKSINSNDKQTSIASYIINKNSKKANYSIKNDATLAKNIDKKPNVGINKKDLYKLADVRKISFINNQYNNVNIK